MLYYAYYYNTNILVGPLDENQREEFQLMQYDPGIDMSVLLFEDSQEFQAYVAHSNATIVAP
jgi:hypothetical protein